MKFFLVMICLVLCNSCGPLGTPLTPLGPHPETMRAKKECPQGEPCETSTDQKKR